MAILTTFLISCTALFMITFFFVIPHSNTPLSYFDIKNAVGVQYELSNIKDDTTTTSTKTLLVTRTRTITRKVTKTRPAIVHAMPTAPSVPVKILGSPVPVEMFVMSQCPDAAYCIHELVLPLMANISDKISLTPSFIGQLDERSGGVTCMHGETECLGNIIELCVHFLYKDEPYVWLPFYDCLSKNASLIPQSDFIHNCAKEHGVDFEKMNACASDMESEKGGGEMLRHSVERSSELGIRTSCTLTIDGKKRCVRDGRKWDRDDCDVDSVRRDIEQLYEKRAAAWVKQEEHGRLFVQEVTEVIEEVN